MISPQVTPVYLTKEELKFLARFVGNHTSAPIFDNLYLKLKTGAKVGDNELDPLNFTLDNPLYPNIPMLGKGSVEL